MIAHLECPRCDYPAIPASGIAEDGAPGWNEDDEADCPACGAHLAARLTGADGGDQWMEAREVGEVVSGPWTSLPTSAPWPDSIGELRPMHALLLAFDLAPNDLYAVVGRLIEEHGFKDLAMAMAFRNALTNGFVGHELVAAVGECAHEGKQLAHVLTEAGRARLAQLNTKMERRPIAAAAIVEGRQRSLFDGGDR